MWFPLFEKDVPEFEKDVSERTVGRFFIRKVDYCKWLAFTP
jgi:hypothetical protein